MVYFIFYEFESFRKLGFKDYIQDLWNIFDITFIVFYISFTIVDIVGVEYEVISILYSILMIPFAIKIFSYLRFIKGFSF